MNIVVCNLRIEKMSYVYDVRVDRASILGNPFYMHNEGERDFVCDEYEKYFDRKILVDDNFKKEVMRLVDIYRKYGKLRLFCWCYPKRCHALYIKEKIEEILKED